MYFIDLKVVQVAYFCCRLRRDFRLVLNVTTMPSDIHYSYIIYIYIAEVVSVYICSVSYNHALIPSSHVDFRSVSSGPPSVEISCRTMYRRRV